MEEKGENITPILQHLFGGHFKYINSIKDPVEKKKAFDNFIEGAKLFAKEHPDFTFAEMARLMKGFREQNEKNADGSATKPQ